VNSSYQKARFVYNKGLALALATNLERCKVLELTSKNVRACQSLLIELLDEAATRRKNITNSHFEKISL